MRFSLSLSTLVMFVASCCALAQDADLLKPQGSAEQIASYASWLDPALDLRDYHIHLRGGMTAEMAVARAKATGVKSGVLENTGREWPLHSNEILDEFITGVEKVNATLPADQRLKIGIQVNDRDWYKTISEKNYSRLDYVLADTMIMGKRPDGPDERLWMLPKDYDVDQDEWFERYFNHCMTVVSEPIDIMANVTYLPDFIADRYDELWTEERMATLIQAAIDGGVALEIQAESQFPKPKFVELALKMGAKISFGTNNFNPKLKSTEAWKRNFDRFHFTSDNLWRDYRCAPDKKTFKNRTLPAAKRDINPRLYLQGSAHDFANYASWLDKSMGVRDWHVHLDQGLDFQMATARAELTKLPVGVLENYGRVWTLKTNDDVEKFIATVKKGNAKLPENERVKIALQVNDRDWYETLDSNLYAQLDYILADSMIMGKKPDGTDNFLWDIPKDYDADPVEWFEEYYRHCLTVVSEPIDIFANVTYLPDFIADRYDELWTKEKMAVLIQSAIDANIALEIQAESPFPKAQFVELALKMGAKFSFGTNNLDSKLKNLDTWKTAIDKYGIGKENLWQGPAEGNRAKPAPKRTIDYAATVEKLKAKGIL